MTALRKNRDNILRARRLSKTERSIALRGQIQHVLHCGTIWVHGPSVQVPTTEEQPRRPFGEYGIQKAAIERYMKAYRETVDFMYNDPKALKIYSEWLNITEAKAKRTRDDFFPRFSIEPDKIVGLDTIVKDAVALKFTANELTKAQLDDMIQIPPR